MAVLFKDGQWEKGYQKKVSGYDTDMLFPISSDHLLDIGAQTLVYQIAMRACQDYMTAYAVILHNGVDAPMRLGDKSYIPQQTTALAVCQECERFFKGDIFEMGCPNIDPDAIIKKLRKNVTDPDFVEARADG